MRDGEFDLPDNRTVCLTISSIGVAFEAETGLMGCSSVSSTTSPADSWG